MRWEVDEDEDQDDPEDPDPDVEGEDDDPTVPCPHCLRPVFEDAERCPGCGHYLSREDAPGRHPALLVIGVLVCLVVVLGWVVR